MKPNILEKITYHLYRRLLRPLLPPKEPILYHGIPVGIDRKFFDMKFPTYKRFYADIPLYEAALIAGIKECIRHGDRVTIIGGGFGATVVFASLAAGKNGHVTCYEASASAIKTSRETVRRNLVSGQISFIHAIVCKAFNTYGSSNSEKVCSPSDIASCDVLELDCEGAELEILKGLTFRPRTILVETHGVYGSSTNEVTNQLIDMGYEVTNMGPAEPRIPEKCVEWDLMMLKANYIKNQIADF
ncbi:FkbM family methyltransferase [Limnobacter sp.]|uniref:FkbM family methyltransferase n=1 Tax=Limnobacter sp. TaxID=2003368 RepID=UPI00273488AB|nr:FkbM family methyltransferase [Limnobacter sp.]MDP3272195.1 FkbM family methyltransferase [Limnobacter sp.]